MLGERIQEACRLRGMDRNDLARASGIGYSTINEIWRGAQKSSTKLYRIAAALRVREEWLATGKGERDAPAAVVPSDDKEWRDVRGFSQSVGLGTGAEADEYAEAHKLKFRAASLRRKRLQPETLSVFYGKGDSMLPRIKSGDAILFDTSDRKPRDGHLYVIQAHGVNTEYQVKRALLLDDVVFFAADNPAGDHNWSKPRRMDAKRGQIEVIGRVRWIGSWED